MSNIVDQKPPSALQCAFYERYVTAMQRPAPIEDQLRPCREFAEGKGWEILPEHFYTDVAVSGTHWNARTELHRLERVAKRHPRPFDCVLMDDFSRVGRNQTDVSKFAKLMASYGIRVCFVNQQLDSWDEDFEALLNAFSLMDELHIERLRSRMKRADSRNLLTVRPSRRINE
jgi:site-specific DNA recombinase